jgi:ABC-2 type transport system permease protein
MKRALVLARLDWRLMRSDPAPLIVSVVMPIVVIAFVKPVFRLALRAQDYESASGAEHAVPGLAVMFSFFLVTFTGYAIFREHGWNTWDRLRSTALTDVGLIVGKALPPISLVLVQQAAVFAAGSLLYGLDVFGATVRLLAISVSLALCLVSIAFALAGICRTVQQLNAIGNLSTVLLGGLGGALAPVGLLPGWAQGAVDAVLLGDRRIPTGTSR